MHCLTETWEVAQAALAMGFYISFSGIVTFENPKLARGRSQRVPLELILIETDSPYLAPVPYRGKLNQPSYVEHVAEEIAVLRGSALGKLGEAPRKTLRGYSSLGELLSNFRN